MRTKIERLQNQLRGGLRFGVSEKGAVSAYGLGHFPVTLYYEQWMRLLDSAEEIRSWRVSNWTERHDRSGACRSLVLTAKVLRFLEMTLDGNGSETMHHS